MQLHEHFRPKVWEDVCGQDKAVRKIQALAKRGLAGRAYWISGQSGTGKTTIARLIASEVADEWCVEEVDATGLSAARIAQLERESQTRGLGKGGRAYIVNESHGLNKAAIRQLLVTLERIPGHVCWIFTTTNDGQ
ncbi:MAG: AAA family ATPase [Planctomycetes bacterium]|nr:AAA family ATPase [Planctomycetota bacterium]